MIVKRFVAVGINSYDAAPLSGCVNDATDWATALADRGFSGYTLLNTEATGAAIRASFRDMLVSSYWGDTVVLTFSGHGTWIPDVDGDEVDGRDEALVPVDYETGSLITDDVLFRLVSDNRARGVKVLIVSDSCHSGTVSRAFGLNDRIPMVRPVIEAPMARFLPPDRVISPDLMDAAREVEKVQLQDRSRTGAALLAACTDIELAWDASFNGRANGAFTRAALDALRLDSPRTLTAWVNRIEARIQYDQTPVAVGTWRQRHLVRWL